MAVLTGTKIQGREHQRTGEALENQNQTLHTNRKPERKVKLYLFFLFSFLVTKVLCVSSTVSINILLLAMR